MLDRFEPLGRSGSPLRKNLHRLCLGGSKHLGCNVEPVGLVSSSDGGQTGLLQAFGVHVLLGKVINPARRVGGGVIDY